MRALPLAALLLSLSSCNLIGVGSAQVTGSVGLLIVLPQTVFSWVDATEDTPSFQDGKLVYKLREKKNLYLVMSGARFDPRQDPRFRSGHDQANLGAEEVLNGRLVIRVKNPELIAPGTTYVFEDGVSVPDNEVSAQPVQISPAAIEVKDDTTHPSGLKPYGRKSIIKVRFDDSDLARGATLSGTLELTIERREGDPADAYTGTLEVSFAAPILGEVMGECSGSGQCDRWGTGSLGN